MTRSQLDMSDTSSLFLWATGIEDTFITEPWPATGRRLDEYELTGHYDNWRGDLDLMAGLGVRTARYGVPWHRINPAENAWDWQWADRPLTRLVDLGIDPIVDLVHYGAPQWTGAAFTDAMYPRRVADYARRLAERHLPNIRCYTPLNEPRITAQYCGRLGWWPPHLHGDRGFLAVMLGVCRGISETVRALRQLDPEIVIVHVDATDIYEAETPDLADSAAIRQELVFLALDLILGRFTRDHPLWQWALRSGGDERALMWFADNPVEIDICGINLYPMFSRKIMRREAGRVRTRMPYAAADIVVRLARLYFERYGLPMMVTETASRGTPARRMQWLTDSIAAVHHCRAEGLPLLGYTWWPMFALVAWAYRQGASPASAYLEQMGLWDLHAKDGGLERVATPLVQAFRNAAQGEMPAVAKTETLSRRDCGRAPAVPVGS